ncbi:MAG TPA: cytochrome c oxidase subunit II [Isosphaeraceae bacterium]|jgi:cytochrome c oxidase subunit 2|nr:cytochrome c oxidase subunit II [Isosphaeraceae bacterium]
MWNIPLFPEQASSLARRVDAVYFSVLGFSVFFTVFICVLIISFAVKYRRGSKASRANAVSENLKIELTWIILPSLIALGLFFWATILFFQMYNAPSDAAEIDVVAKQWMWYLQHPEGRREINELHLPLNRPVRLTMISQDVIHSFYVPAFRAKQDVLPDRYTSIWFQPTKIGRYHLFCAEYCGTNHSGMIGSVIVMEPSEYQDWLESGTVRDSMASAGAKLFRQFGCSGCHSEHSSIRAPRLEGVYGKPVPLSNGEIVIADDRYIRDSVLMPKAQVVAGFEPVMPTFQGQIKEDELLQIIAYIRSLGKERRAGQ